MMPPPYEHNYLLQFCQIQQNIKSVASSVALSISSCTANGKHKACEYNLELISSPLPENSTSKTSSRNDTGVFITASKTETGLYDYNTTLVVFLSELLKLIISAVLYTYKQENKPNIFSAIVINYNLLLLYFIPSLLYCFYNNLAFINLSHYDPTSYYILLQFRVVITAFIFQFLFKRKLATIQWISLGILTMGCMIKNFDAATIISKVITLFTIISICLVVIAVAMYFKNPVNNVLPTTVHDIKDRKSLLDEIVD
ncbi:unnamed protein product [Leptidea sinapis]|uniref:Uncharacterized protein n=1 Tax=Leptidea sinapis TaxID=189913 RepID=A0A5E4QPR8_9NEOP|nr:unnamed protein product [Leptidea sinapis]